MSTAHTSFVVLILLAAATHAQPGPLAWRRARLLETKIFPSAAYDAARQRVVLFGGDLSWHCDGCPEFISDSTVEWDGTSWTQREPATRPYPRFQASMAYDRARQRVVPTP